MNIILCHGILGFNKIGPINYFRGVADHFRNLGHKVLVPQVNPTQGYKFRGAQRRFFANCVTHGGCRARFPRGARRRT